MKEQIARNFLYNLFTSNYQTQEHLLLRRLIMINAFLIIGTLAFTTFAFLNYFVAQKNLIALFDTVAALIFILGFADLRINRNEKRVIAVSSSILVLFMFLFIPANENRSFGLIWTIFVPVFVISLYGHKRGLIISALYYTVVFSLAIHGLSTWENGTWDTIALTRFIIASCVLVFVVFITEYSFDKLQKKLQKLSIIDPLTELYNRRKIDEVISEELKKCNRYHQHFSLAILDVDNFKRINDTYGHPTGDKVLVELSAILKQTVREVDTVGRWGGEEFIIVMPQTDSDNALKSLERLRSTINTYTFTDAGQVSCSFGVCSVKNRPLEKRQLISCADQALYKAKQNGKDRVFSLQPSTLSQTRCA